ncbi:Signal peptidase complex subunit [Microsporum canis]|uniref:Signal peptidase subunit 3 n=1 Tax=Arthroderma otae (strain ATCC MYA-4605 / CBS 113480) TaxID=554155 RepID=C5FI59_ARTOC|nr:conserved hypothetical protein [Microsporum canis CBS 113480]EEQ29039.1 conserved hypothetical protein [Microsporum canis CBS 113480]
MHSVTTRFQGVFGYLTTVALVLGAVIAASVFLHPADPTTSIKLSNVQVVKGRPHYYASRREEYAQIKFDLEADLTSLFNFNTKQVFVYVLAAYPSASNQSVTTEAVIWDKIIPASVSPYSLASLKSQFLPDTKASKTKRKTPKNKNKLKENENDVPGKLKLRNQKPKYQITDISGSIAEREGVQLIVGWNVQPWIGALQWSENTNMKKNVGGIFGRIFLLNAGPKGALSGRSEPFNFPALKKPKPATP